MALAFDTQFVPLGERVWCARDSWDADPSTDRALGAAGSRIETVSSPAVTPRSDTRGASCLLLSESLSGTSPEADRVHVAVRLRAEDSLGRKPRLLRNV